MIIQWVTCIILVIVILVLIKLIFRLFIEECKNINSDSTSGVIITKSDNVPIAKGVLVNNNDELNIIDV